MISSLARWGTAQERQPFSAYASSTGSLMVHINKQLLSRTRSATMPGMNQVLARGHAVRRSAYTRSNTTLDLCQSSRTWPSPVTAVRHDDTHAVSPCRKPGTTFHG